MSELWNWIPEVWKSLTTYFTGLSEYLGELFFYFLNVSIDAAKGKGWKGILFLIPLWIAIVLVIYWIIKIVI